LSSPCCCARCCCKGGYVCAYSFVRCCMIRVRHCTTEYGGSHHRYLAGLTGACKCVLSLISGSCCRVYCSCVLCCCECFWQAWICVQLSCTASILVQHAKVGRSGRRTSHQMHLRELSELVVGVVCSGPGFWHFILRWCTVVYVVDAC